MNRWGFLGILTGLLSTQKELTPLNAVGAVAAGNIGADVIREISDKPASDTKKETEENTLARCSVPSTKERYKPDELVYAYISDDMVLQDVQSVVLGTVPGAPHRVVIDADGYGVNLDESRLSRHSKGHTVVPDYLPDSIGGKFAYVPVVSTAGFKPGDKVWARVYGADIPGEVLGTIPGHPNKVVIMGVEHEHLVNEDKLERR